MIKMMNNFFFFCTVFTKKIHVVTYHTCVRNSLVPKLSLANSVHDDKYTLDSTT